MNKIKNIAKFTSQVILLLAITLILPLIVSLIRGELNSTIAFLCTMAFCFVLFLFVHILCRNSNYSFKYRDGFVISTFVWLIITLIGSLPYLLSGELSNVFDAIFESASGFSTTGASVITNIEALPKSMQFYRSMTNWIGGMGILVLLSAVLPSWGVNGQKIAFNESTGPSKGKLTSRFSDTARILYAFYIFITIIMIITLKLCGMTLFDSVTHTFATVATGGFSNYNDGLMHFTSPVIRIVFIIFMFIAGTNFNLLIVLGTKDGRKSFIKDEEVRFYYKLVLFSTLLVFAYNLGYYKTNLGNTLLDALFQTTSIITTTGFATVDFNLWATFPKAVLFLLFFTGGCASSTSGGIKCIRLIICNKLMRRSFSLKMHPNRVASFRLNNHEIQTDIVIRVTTFILTYFFIIIVSTMMLSISGNDLITNLSATASCLGNVGPGFNLIGPAANYSCFTGFSKFICSMLMIMGRLELMTVFVLFSRNYWNPDKVY